MAGLHVIRRQSDIYFLRVTRWARQTCARLATPTSISTGYVWIAMAGAALTLACGIRSFGFLHPGLLVIYALGFLGIEIFEERVPELRSLAPTLMLVAAIQLSLSEALVVALIWYGARFSDGRRDLYSLVVRAAFVIVAVGSVSVIVHAAVFVKVLAIKATLAALCYFAVNYLSALVLQSFERERWTGWQHDVAFGSWFLQAAFVGLLSEVIAETSEWTPLLAIPGTYLLHRWFRSDTLNTINHAEDMAALHLRTIEALALAIEAKDHTTADHLRRVQVYATEPGKELKLSALELEALRAASLLHDIGKLAVPEHIISKPGKLTREEFEKMKIHPTVGAEILEHVKFPYPVAPIVAAHHEHWDGSGYPRGLQGEQIPIGARILSAVDCLDALATDRQYRRALPLDDAMKVLLVEAGKSFDPQVVALLQRRYVELEEMAKGDPTPALSTEEVVERGNAPAAGFEVGSATSRTSQPDAIDNATATAAAYHESQRLFGMARGLEELTLQEILAILSLRIKAIIPFDGLAVYVKKDRVLEPAFVTGDDSHLFGSLRIPMGEGLSGWVAENKKPILNGNPSVEPGYLNNPTIVSMLQSALAVPLEGSEGVVGVLALYQKSKDVFTSDQLRLLDALGANLAIFIDNCSQGRQFETDTAREAMTGSPSILALMLHLNAEIERCRANQLSLRVLACDLDDFKVINDRFGHLTGDHILRVLGDAFHRICADYGYIARSGGNEFVIILPSATEHSMDALTARLRAAACEIGWSVCQEDLLRLSFGSAVMPPEGGAPHALIRDAESRMRLVKRQRKSWALENGTNSSSAPQSFRDDPCTLESRPSISLQLGYASNRRDKTA